MKHFVPRVFDRLANPIRDFVARKTHRPQYRIAPEVGGGAPIVIRHLSARSNGAHFLFTTAHGKRSGTHEYESLMRESVPYLSSDRPREKRKVSIKLYNGTESEEEEGGAERWNRK